MTLLPQTSNLCKLSRSNNIWPEIFFLAEANNEKFTELIILTSCAYRKEKALEKAFIITTNFEDIQNLVLKIYKSSPVEQFMEVFKDNILVVIDVPKINDTVTNKILVMMSQVSNFQIGKRINLYDIFK